MAHATIRVAWFASLLGTMALAATANAQPPDTEAQVRAEARKAFNEGKVLEEAGDYAAALAKFKHVAEVIVTPQVRFHVALCEERLGKFVSAMKGFELAAEEARQAGSSAVEVAENAPPRADALRKRIGHLRIAIKGHLSTSKVTLDGAALPADKLAGETLVDPGKHVVQLVSSDGKTTFQKDLFFTEGSSEKVAIEVNDVEPEANPAVVAVPGRQPEPATPPPPRSRIPAYVAGGVSVASFVGAGVFYGLSSKDKNTVIAHCQDKVNFTGCDPRGKPIGDEGSTFNMASSILIGVGAAAAATAVIYILVTPNKGAEAPKSSSLVLAPTLGGVQLSGRF